METTERIGDRIRALRDERGLSQGELAAKAGTSSQTISNIERGRHQPTFDTMTKIARALGVRAGDLIG